MSIPSELSADVESTMQNIAIYIEKQGKSAHYNYHPTNEEIEEKKEKIQKEEEIKKNKEDVDREQKSKYEQEDRSNKEINSEKRKLAVELESKALIEAASQPLRAYLMDNVIPAVIDGLLDVCKQKPEDPIDYLAEFLFKFSVGGGANQKE